MKRLDGKVIMLTGAAGGIGSVIAEGFAREGASLALVDLDGARVEELAGRIGGDVLAIEADATDDAAMAAAVAEAENERGGIDVMFNNAGIAAPGALEEITPEYFQKVMRINTYSAVAGSKAAVPALARRGGGKIINTCSVAGKTAYGGHTAYGMSKFAVRGFTQGLAKELGPRGITVNAICPGMVRTPIWDGIAAEMVDAGEIEKPEEAADTFAAGLNVVLGRGSVPEDLVGITLFLASGDSDYMTGQCLNIDGGLAFD